MEVACSLDDVARVLADNGYLNDDSCCFANAGADFPSVLSALDSPDSFPESPCSDEDIARVLDIARMPSPSLLDSCTPSTHTFQSHDHINHLHSHNHPYLPSPTESLDTYDNIPFHKTRDPCITNAFLQGSILPPYHHDHQRHPNHNRKHNHQHQPATLTEPPHSLDLFTIDMNSSFHGESVSHFSHNLVTTRDINNNNARNEAFTNYFNSSSALSPVSETDIILSIPPLDPSSLLTNQPADQPSTHSKSNTRIESITHAQISTHLIPTIETHSSNNSTDIIPSQINTLQVNTTQTKRKRRRKSSHVTPKPKRRKQQDKSQMPSKPKSAPKPKEKITKGNSKSTDSLCQSNTPDESTNKTGTGSVSKRKNATNSNSGPRKSNRSKINNSFTLETIQECGEGIGTSSNAESGTPLSSANLDFVTTEIGSTNGISEECKTGPRRSSRSTKNIENYNFRLSSLVKRVETERKQQEPKQPKGKAKPPPLSKYRRRTANARERDRMKEINDAFDVLKNALPDMEPEDGKNKITKFTILKLALNYISSLQEILGLDLTQPISSNNENFSASDLQCSSSNSDLNGNCTTSLVKMESVNDVSEITNT